MPCVINTWSNTLHLFFALLYFRISEVYNYRIRCWPLFHPLVWLLGGSFQFETKIPQFRENFWIIFLYLIFSRFLFFLSGAVAICRTPVLISHYLYLLLISMISPLYFLRDFIHFMYFLKHFFSHPIFYEVFFFFNLVSPLNVFFLSQGSPLQSQDIQHNLSFLCFLSCPQFLLLFVRG